MSSIHHATGLDNGRPPRASRFSKDLQLRFLVGGLLAAVAVAATVLGGYFFAGFVALGAAAAAREWHRMIGTARFGREGTATSIAVAAVSVAAVASSAPSWPLAILAIGGLLAAGLGATRGAPVFWSGLGAFYIGIPAWSLVTLRTHVPDAPWVVLGVFLTIWTADTGALLVGQIIGGPKLFPVLSPNKTWAGLAGGLVLPGLAAAGYVAAFGGSVWRGFAVGLVLAFAGHAGDLFESWIKRRVGRKNSGELIPGHGGVLDRIDSTLFVAPLAALLFFFFGAAQWLGVHA